jgi:hypothetical protein
MLCNAAAGSSCNIALQLVLLPPFAADISPDSPPRRVIELRHDITLRKSPQGRRGKAMQFTYPLAGLTLRRSEPTTNGWFLRGRCDGISLCIIR